MKRFIFINAFCALVLCSILTSGAAAQTFSWGYSTSGRLGFVTDEYLIPTPQPVAALSDVTNIGGGEYVTLFLRANGTIAAAGANTSGEMGIGNVSNGYPIPSTVLNLSGVTQVSGGWSFSTALKADGTVWAWGVNHYGQLGNGTIYDTNGSSNYWTPQQTLISDVVQISSLFSNTVALKADGTVWGWGNGTSTQVGGLTPQRVGENVAGFEDIIAVAAGEYHSVALKADGTVWVWGSSSFGLDGNGVEYTNYPNYRLPRQVPNFGDVVQIAAGDIHIAALKRDGSVWVWVGNSGGVCGGTLRDYLHSTRLRRIWMCLTPTRVNISEVVEIKSGMMHLVARKRDGSVWAWGNNNFGVIGDGTFAGNSMFNGTPYPTQAFAGTGNALIGAVMRSSYAVKPVIQTPVGFGVIHYGENAQMLFSNVTGAGTTAYTAVDPATINLNVPKGLTIQPNEPAYNISTTAQTSGETEVCVKVNEFSRSEFPLLKILHAEGANWVDRTFSSDYRRRRVCARVTTSLSTFVIAKTASPFPNVLDNLER